MPLRCSRCKLDKPPGEFGAHRGKRSDKALYCLECARSCDRSRRMDPGVLAREAAAAREYRMDPEVRARQAATMRERRKDPRTKAMIKIYDAAYRASHLELRQSYDRSERKRVKAREYMVSPEGRENRRMNEARRRARLHQVTSNLTHDEWAEIVRDFGGACAYCLESGKSLEIEHVRPVSKGGSHTRDNVVPACASCNKSKGNKNLLQFA